MRTLHSVGTAEEMRLLAESYLMVRAVVMDGMCSYFRNGQVATDSGSRLTALTLLRSKTSFFNCDGLSSERTTLSSRESSRSRLSRLTSKLVGACVLTVILILYVYDIDRTCALGFE